MTQVNIAEDCGNSPKNMFIQKLTIAFAKADAKFILSSVTEDIHWHIVGQKTIEGKTEFAKALEQRAKDKALELSIRHVMTHGKAGAVNGVLKFKSGSSPRVFYRVGFQRGKSTRSPGNM